LGEGEKPQKAVGQEGEMVISSNRPRGDAEEGQLPKKSEAGVWAEGAHEQYTESSPLRGTQFNEEERGLVALNGYAEVPQKDKVPSTLSKDGAKKDWLKSLK